MQVKLISNLLSLKNFGHSLISKLDFSNILCHGNKGNIPVYRDVFSSNNRNSCSKIVDGNVSTVQSLPRFYDEADECLMYHLNQAIRCDHIEIVHVVTGDTEIFVNLMYNFVESSEHGLEEICTHHLNKSSAIRESVKNLPGYVVELLPSIHALPVCDTTSKVAHKAVYISMNEFGIKKLDERMYIIPFPCQCHKCARDNMYLQNKPCKML